MLGVLGGFWGSSRVLVRFKGSEGRWVAPLRTSETRDYQGRWFLSGERGDIPWDLAFLGLEMECLRGCRSNESSASFFPR